MFSISKIVALIAIIVAVWQGFKLIGRLDEARRRKADATNRADVKRARSEGADQRRTEESADGVLDLVKDERGNYVAKDKRDDRV